MKTFGMQFREEEILGTYAKIQQKHLQHLLQQPLCALLSHWVFQSLWYMDTTERWFKVGLNLIMTLALGAVLNIHRQGFLPWLVALVVAHTLNFLLNGHVWGVLKHYGFVRHYKADFEAYVLAFCRRARAQRSIEQVLAFGSLARGEWKDSSDLDARIIRKPGMRNGLAACIFLLLERTRALFAGFPLDVYVLDGVCSKRRACLSEPGKDLLASEWRFLS